MLVYITGTVDQELLLRNEYLAAENRILKARLTGRLFLSDAERARLAEIGHPLGRKAPEDVANTAKPDTILGWYRKLIARKTLILKEFATGTFDNLETRTPKWRSAPAILCAAQ